MVSARAFPDRVIDGDVAHLAAAGFDAGQHARGKRRSDHGLHAGRAAATRRQHGDALHEGAAAGSPAPASSCTRVRVRVRFSAHSFSQSSAAFTSSFFLFALLLFCMVVMGLGACQQLFPIQYFQKVLESYQLIT